MKKWAVLCGVMLLFAGIASAQDDSKVTLFGGYSYIHASISGGGGTGSFNGGSGSIAYNLTPMFGVVADFGGYHLSQNGTDATLVTYLFGPKVSIHAGPLTPFAQALFGGGHISGSGGCDSVTLAAVTPATGCGFGGAGSENAFATALGGGVDWNATEHLGVRLAQVEYLLTTFNDGINNRQNSVRVSAGVTFRF